MFILFLIALAAPASGTPASGMTDAHKAQLKVAAQAWGGCIAATSAGRTTYDVTTVDELLKTCAGAEAALEAALARGVGSEHAKGQMVKAREAVRTSLLKAAPRE